jgi:hypothetical protein
MVVRVLLAFLLMAGQHAQAAETAEIQLSCTGPAETVTEPGKNFIAKEGLVVNLADRTVSGFGVVAQIERIDDTSIWFRGEEWEPIGTFFLTGKLDRISGALSARRELMVSTCPESGCEKGTKIGNEIEQRINFELVCKVANRLF